MKNLRAQGAAPIGEQMPITRSCRVRRLERCCVARSVTRAPALRVGAASHGRAADAGSASICGVFGEAVQESPACLMIERVRTSEPNGCRHAPGQGRHTPARKKPGNAWRRRRDSPRELQCRVASVRRAPGTDLRSASSKGDPRKGRGHVARPVRASARSRIEELAARSIAPSRAPSRGDCSTEPGCRSCETQVSRWYYRRRSRLRSRIPCPTCCNSWAVCPACAQTVQPRRCLQIASSLTFTTLLALVPLGAIALALWRRFPVFFRAGEQIHAFLLANMLPRERGEVVTGYIEQFSAGRQLPFSAPCARCRGS